MEVRVIGLMRVGGIENRIAMERPRIYTPKGSHREQNSRRVFEQSKCPDESIQSGQCPCLQYSQLPFKDFGNNHCTTHLDLQIRYMAIKCASLCL